MGGREELARSALAAFLGKHGALDSISSIDEIVLSYVGSILEELGEDSSPQEAFDIEDFTEMMEAYLPGFSNIDSVKVCDWMFDLAARINNQHNTPGTDDSKYENEQEVSISNSVHLPEEPVSLPQNINNEQNSEIPDTCASPTTLFNFKNIFSTSLNDKTLTSLKTGTSPNSSPPKAISMSLGTSPKMNMGPSSESLKCPLGTSPKAKSSLHPKGGRSGRSGQGTSPRKRNVSRGEEDAGSEPVRADTNGDHLEVEDPKIEQLLEMFPASCSVEVAHCLGLAGGDTDKTVQLILHRQEIGDSFTKSKLKPHKASAKKKSLRELDDGKMKKTIVERYSFVDTDDDKRDHQPLMPKGESKKLVRYRDSKVVSMKGERFSDVKKPEDEDMKKTYVSLKPAKQYRFH